MFGLRCRFTDCVLRALVSQGVTPLAILIPGPPSLTAPTMVTTRRSILPMAGAQAPLIDVPGVPVYQVGSVTDSPTLDLIQSIAPDIVVVACYPSRIPRVVRQIAPHGAINVHPSLLPRRRGPDPLFWTFRRGDAVTGVTVHELTDRLDAGPILAQEHIGVDAGITEADLERQAATRGGDLAARVVHELRAGSARPQPQPEEHASYEPWPELEDYVISTSESAETAYRFVRGVRERGLPIVVDTGTTLAPVRDALRYAADPDTSSDTTAASWIRFADGYLLVQMALS